MTLLQETPPRPTERLLRTVDAVVATPPPRATIVLALVAAVLLGLAVVVVRPPATPHCAPVATPQYPDRTPLPASDPVALTVGSIDACSTLLPVGLDDERRIAVPSVHTPQQAGWYRLGPTPGALGPAVVVGHINGDGQEGVFADLDDVGAGDRVAVSRRDGRTAFFTVSQVVQADKDAFPTTAVYGNTPDAELRLITCGGALDRSAHRYQDNVIVFATYDGWSPTRP
ncbi:class F sortase [Actinomycetospora sp. TBRC 11914]|uniref:class F sortase n=1 Tax=Actinomycetospora sp. TBRC 11914 TaxID=2729387 RepID=UPI00145F93C4|nr:class F sortase [Actinomycetospora sp. TBRC 11914]NMO92824.1 class F sortase [Actinomycetospora sp. TBRC 11914]